MACWRIISGFVMIASVISPARLVTMKMGKVIFLAALVALLAMGSTAFCQNKFPADWAGSWQLVEVRKDCDSGMVLDTTKRWVTIWPGDGPSDWDASLIFGRETVSITVDEFDYSGNDTYEELPCTIMASISYTMTRSGENLVGSKRDNHVVLNCNGSYCYKYEITGERNPTPTTATAWGSIKALYK
jgi:hypothetical protein